MRRSKTREKPALGVPGFRYFGCTNMLQTSSVSIDQSETQSFTEIRSIQTALTDAAGYSDRPAACVPLYHFCSAAEPCGILGGEGGGSVCMCVCGGFVFIFSWMMNSFTAAAKFSCPLLLGGREHAVSDICRNIDSLDACLGINVWACEVCR